MPNDAMPDLDTAPAYVLAAAIGEGRLSAREACEAAIRPSRTAARCGGRHARLPGDSFLRGIHFNAA